LAATAATSDTAMSRHSARESVIAEDSVNIQHVRAGFAAKTATEKGQLKKRQGKKRQPFSDNIVLPFFPLPLFHTLIFCCPVFLHSHFLLPIFPIAQFSGCLFTFYRGRASSYLSQRRKANYTAGQKSKLL